MQDEKIDGHGHGLGDVTAQCSMGSGSDPRTEGGCEWKHGWNRNTVSSFAITLRRRHVLGFDASPTLGHEMLTLGETE